MRILIIEDSEVAAQILTANLKDLAKEEKWDEKNCALDVFGTLTDGLGALKSGPYDLVFLDLNLPDSSNLDTIKRFREADYGMPVIVLTSIDDTDLVLQAIRNDVQEYLVKDELTPSMLKRTIRSAVERKKQSDSLKKQVTDLKMSNQLMIDRNMGLF